MITANKAREISAGGYSLHKIEECIKDCAESQERHCTYNYNDLDDIDNIISVLTQQGFKVAVYSTKSILSIHW